MYIDRSWFLAALIAPFLGTLCGCGGDQFAAGADDPAQLDGGGAAETSHSDVGPDQKASSPEASEGQDAATTDARPVPEEAGSSPDSGVDAGTGEDAADAGVDSAPSEDVDAGCTPVTHDNGLGQTWQDCVPRDTYDEAEAMAACRAWASAPSECYVLTSGLCNAIQGYRNDGIPADLISSIWGYGTGALAGHVSTTACPTANDAQWH